jgi:hypothetical protein
MESEWICMFRRIRQPYAPVPSRISRDQSSAAAIEKCEDRQTTEIYRVVLRRLFGSESFFDGESVKPLLFILYTEADESADADDRRNGAPFFPEVIRRGISRGSRNLPVRIVWVEDAYDVGGSAGEGYVPSEGAAVTFTGVRRDGDDLAFVNGSIHSWGRSPRSFEYVVEKKNGFWMVRSSYHQWID